MCEACAISFSVLSLVYLQRFLIVVQYYVDYREKRLPYIEYSTVNLIMNQSVINELLNPHTIINLTNVDDELSNYRSKLGGLAGDSSTDHVTMVTELGIARLIVEELHYRAQCAGLDFRR
jgi:hypothetical protein